MICVVLLITCVLLFPGYSLAETPKEPLKTPLHMPAYINSIDDLHTVHAIPHKAPTPPRAPSTSDPDVVELLQQLNETLILGYLENLTSFGPRLSGTSACDQAAHYLYGTFQDMGLAVRYHNYTDTTVSGSNIEATLYGSNSTNILLICAHYDSVAAGPGADDDGSGVAAVLAAAKIMRNYEFYHTVRFVCFSGEEQGLIGSRHYAEDAYHNNDSIIAVLNADMIGFALSSSDGTKGKIFSNTPSEWIVEYTQDISLLYTDYIHIELTPAGTSSGSDHYYFWQYGYNAVFYHEYRFNSYYHSADDTIEHMNITYSTHFSRLILATLAEMASQPRPVLEIISISGGLGITTEVHNRGSVNATDAEVTVNLNGGLFGFIDVSSKTTQQILLPDDVMQGTARVFRIGPIDITVTATASNANQVLKRGTGFLLGPFVFKIIILP
jgi:hypothetical protein